MEFGAIGVAALGRRSAQVLRLPSMVTTGSSWRLLCHPNMHTAFTRYAHYAALLGSQHLSQHSGKALQFLLGSICVRGAPLRPAAGLGGR